MTGSRWTLLTSTGLVLLSPFKERVIMLVSPASSYVFWKSLRSSWIEVDVILLPKILAGSIPCLRKFFTLRPVSVRGSAERPICFLVVDLVFALVVGMVILYLRV